MKNPSLAELQAWFSSASRDHGWSNIVAYDQHTLNALLEHQHIEKFHDQQSLPSFSGSVGEGNTIEHLSGIRLREPRLFFELSGQDSGSALLVMDLAGGMLITEERNASNSYFSVIRELVPAARPRLSFVTRLIDLSGAPQSDGSIVLDLSKGKEYKVNFVLDTLSQVQIGGRFEEFFKDVPAQCKRFTLGRMDSADGVPPLKIQLRAMAAPGADQPASPNYRDGALLLFVAYGPFDGTIPHPSEFPYPIPADGANPFSTTFMIFHQYHQPPGANPRSDEPELILPDFYLGDHLENAVWALGGAPDFGQLAFYGHIRLKNHAFAIVPALPTVVAGARQRFYTSPSASGLRWSVQATETGDSQIGRIGIDGVYTAPASIAHASKTVMVTAEGMVTGKVYRTSTLVTVLRESISVSPLFSTCSPEQSVELTAYPTVGTNPDIRWSLRDPEQGGQLDASRDRCVYTAGKVGFGTPPFVDVIDVFNEYTKETKSIHILVATPGSGMPLFVSEDSRPEDNQVQLRVIVDKVEMDLGDLPDEYTVAQYGYSYGQIDGQGIYRASANAQGVVILVVSIPDPLFSSHGFLALPLPLWAHADALRRSNESLRSHVRTALQIK
ncbi:hypothetical protein [Pseudomonas putida]|uniref:Uncharacterized protein n=1 Tax=Pseudomonas putida TaxID=303 RepID=A0A177SWK4_PSEPU|nr:hypothetical protein [Pseudomonas putida]OAI94700.1 hypothetical protein AYO28_06635 [Pseudomonas putida]